jgi:ketosteroid isomerase-like protein
MYAKIVERICRKAFLAVNRQDYGVLLSMCDPLIVHRFGGSHALGGTRHTRDGLRLWFARLGRIVPSLTLTIDDIWVKGGPWKTTAIVRWTSTGTPLDGELYDNHGVHIVQMRWGKAVSIDANEDSQAVANLLRRQAACGIEEAIAPRSSPSAQNQASRPTFHV